MLVVGATEIIGALEIDGMNVGIRVVGWAVVGVTVGLNVGATVGTREGRKVMVGMAVVGFRVGMAVVGFREIVGFREGLAEGEAEVGLTVGPSVGIIVGSSVGVPPDPKKAQNNVNKNIIFLIFDALF